MAADRPALRQEAFVELAAETLCSAEGRDLRSLQELIHLLEAVCGGGESSRLPCRDTMYKYLRLAGRQFAAENESAGMNAFALFQGYAQANAALFGLKRTTRFHYSTLAEDQNGWYLGLLLVPGENVAAARQYLQKRFAPFLQSIFPGTGGLLLLFRSANREAEFYNLLVEHNAPPDEL
ncbi:MAG: hypothetical protein LBJ11_05360 [Oscillospiraceae bacterium]|nr:hypothetical protein [Oscillospiraceae bacterium]